MRYTSAAYGYTLLVPVSWVRVPGVRWTPAGPPTDLTLMTHDHQAALGMIVAPSGNRSYTDAALLGVAGRLLYQENYVHDSTRITTKRLVINHVAYQTASYVAFSGVSPSMVTAESVAVTQRHHRLYALVSLVYLEEYSIPTVRSSPPTPTPEAGTGHRLAAPTGAGNRGSAPAALPTPLPLARAGWLRPAAPPAPLPTDHWRGNLCHRVDDGGLIIVDRNCASAAEQRTLAAIASTLSFTPGGADDPRPAAAVGVDGFAVATDPAQGFRIEYPAQWMPVSVQGTNGAVRSADQNAVVTLLVRPIDAEALSPSDLQVAADTQIGHLGTTSPSSVSYHPVRVNGIPFLLATIAYISISTADGGLGSAQGSVVVAAYHHRLYTVIGLGLIVSSSATTPPILYPYFSPFTALARAYQSAADTRRQEAALTLQTAQTLFVDPHVQSPR